MASTRFAGTAYMKADGKQFETIGTFNINRGLPKREGKLGTVGFVGHAEMPQIPSIECKIALVPGLTIEEIAGLENATITAIAPNGTSFVLRDAYQAGECTYSTAEGEVSAKFEGSKMEEIPA